MLELYYLTTDFLRFCELVDLFCKYEVRMCICLCVYNKSVFILTTLKSEQWEWHYCRISRRIFRARKCTLVVIRLNLILSVGETD